MASDLSINVEPWETRVALLENGQLAEFHVERASERGYVGNIYKGRVVRVLPGMQAAFVDIGLERTAFLYVSDVYDHLSEFESLLGREGGEEEPEEESVPLPFDQDLFRIEELLHHGQEILVQVAKGPVGSKGARVTSHISIPGRHLVLMPTMDHVGVSKRIQDEKERKRLRDLIEAMRPKDLGFIVRTASEGASALDIQNEMEFLVKLWEGVQNRAASLSVPSLVYEDLDITLRAVRDLFTTEVQRLVVDDETAYGRIVEFVDTFAHNLKPRVEFYDFPQPIFEAFGIEMELSRLLGKKVWLKSGGYIVIDSTEALTVIDVNTGSYVGKRNLEETILKTNLEAAKEIAYQLRLRNIGGIIIIDFIDMEDPAHREEVFKTLHEALKRDKTKVHVLRMSELGLVQMTRKRSRDPVSEILSEPCPYCEGGGIVRSRRAMVYEIFRKVRAEARWHGGERVEIWVHPEVARFILNEEASHLEALEEKVKKELSVVPKPEFHWEKYEIHYRI